MKQKYDEANFNDTVIRNVYNYLIKYPDENWREVGRLINKTCCWATPGSIIKIKFTLHKAIKANGSINGEFYNVNVLKEAYLILCDSENQVLYDYKKDKRRQRLENAYDI